MSVIACTSTQLAVPNPAAAKPTVAERLQFESLLADLSARFVNAPVDELDAEIFNAQRELCDFFRVDRSTVWQSHSPGEFVLTHFYEPTPGQVIPHRPKVRDFFPWSIDQILRGKTLAIADTTDLPPEAARDAEAWRSYGTKSTLVLPLSTGRGPVFGLLSFAALNCARDWPEVIVTRCRLIAEVLANALARKRADAELQRTLEELRHLREQLQHENVYLRKEVQALQGQMPIVGSSPALREVLARAEQVAATDSTVLILGETGTGKELLARYIQGISRRSAKPFIVANLAAMPATLLESELFGREKGAYTGAMTRQAGRFELADGGTLFLDEIGEMPMETQAKLLRVLQSGELERLGSGRTQRVNVRMIAATNRSLPELIKAGQFRQDLYYRLNIFPITLPPLRERPEDLPVLVWAFVREFAERMGKPIESIRKSDLAALASYGWPGNVRELRNLVERSMILVEGNRLCLELPEAEAGPAAGLGGVCRTLREVQRQHILKVLKATGGRLRGRSGAAEILDMKPTTLYSLMQRLGVERPR